MLEDLLYIHYKFVFDDHAISKHLSRDILQCQHADRNIHNYGKQETG